MTTGYKINKASDNAAGFSISESWQTKLGSLDIAAQNIAMGIDMLNTSEGSYNLISTHLQRVRDLTEQAANGTYGSQSLNAIGKEIEARLNEIDRIAASTEYNGISLMKANPSNIPLQVGITSNTTNSQIVLDSTLFAEATAKALFGGSDTIAQIVTKCKTTSTAPGMLSVIDTAINNISNRMTNLGAYQNRLTSAEESNYTQTQNLTSSLSTLRDADVAKESSDYIQAQILQQASATLLSTANQAPSIALNLI
jgi:flagellin